MQIVSTLEIDCQNLVNPLKALWTTRNTHFQDITYFFAFLQSWFRILISLYCGHVLEWTKEDTLSEIYKTIKLK